MSKAEGLLEKVGLSLGPIGMTLGESKAKLEASVDDDFDDDDVENDENDVVAKGGEMLDNAGLSLGPIGMTLGGAKAKAKAKAAGVGPDASAGTGASAKPKSIAPLTTAEWRAKNVNPDGTVDLFVEDHYNVASRVAGGVEGLSQGGGSSDNNLVNVENIAWSGLPSDAVDGARHRVAVTDHVTGEVLELDVPENRYVLFEAEQEGWELPNACRMGCCTKCAVRVTKGKLEQREALGLSRRYRDEGYALLCVSTVVAGPVECVTQDEEEIYQKQFGEVFNELAADKRSKAVVRDDFALEIADMDE
jgi:ferredoxin